MDFKTTGLELIDIDGDGWTDILFAGRRELVWLQNPGAHTDDPWHRHILAEGVSESELVLCFEVMPRPIR